MNTWLAALIGLFGNFLLSLGMVLQKRHVAWLGYKGEKGKAYHRDVAGWTAGFILMNLAPIGNYFALMGLPANVVSALLGSNVAFTAILVSLLLGERLGKVRLAWTLFLFAALGLAGLRGGSTGTSLNRLALYAAVALPAILIGGAWLARRRKPGKGLAVIIAMIAGSLGGSMVLSMRALQLDAGNAFLRWLGTPWFYLYFLAGILGFASIQLAYKDGDMASVSPAYYGMQVLWPALASYAVLGTAFDALQVAAFVAIALAVVAITRAGEASRGSVAAQSGGAA
jgi:drug/metabolite transporter (DMT)-like permease